MNSVKKLFTNAWSLTMGKGSLTDPTPFNTIGLTSVSVSQEDLESKQAVYPQWFFSARLGQPRGINTNTIRNLAQSAWVQMVLNTFKKQIYTMDWRIVPIDPEDGIDYKEKIKTVTEKLNNINNNGDRINDLDSEVVTDLGEIDAGVYNYVYSADSYDIGQLPVYDARGRVIGTEEGLVLKQFGKRTLTQVKTVDASTILKQVDLYKNLLNYWQYSFKHPRQNPTPFSPDEIGYVMLNKKSYSVYGFSPVQAIQQILELLIQGTRYNKEIFTNNAIPDMLVSLKKIPSEQLKKLKRIWNNEYKGRPHQMGFINWPIDNIQKLAESNRDLEWLDGQKWYFKIAFAVFGVSPTEAGFFENSNRSNDQGQERVTVRNALRPFLKGPEDMHTKKLIPEILQEEKPGIKFEYIIKDDVAERIEFDQLMQQLDRGIITINEFRKEKGKKDVDWGDEPLRRPFNPETDFQNFGNFGNPKPEGNTNDDQKEEMDNKNKDYTVKDYTMTKPKDVEECVRALMADPEFKPQSGRTKEESAWAVCQAQQKKTYKDSFEEFMKNGK